MELELNECVYKKIEELSKEGDLLLENAKAEEAIAKYKQAIELLPSPVYIWEAATWLFTAIGDAYFMSKHYDLGLNNFFEAQKCPEGFGNPFIYLRIGQCFFEIKKHEKATQYLLQAYMLDGEDVFTDSDPKYLEFINDLI